MREREFVEKQLKAMGNSPHRNPDEHGGDSTPIEGSQVDTQRASTYESEKGTPYMQELLGLKDLDNVRETKLQEVERYIIQEIENGRLPDRVKSYHTILDRMFGDTKQLEMAVRSGRADKMLNLMFEHVALQNKMSVNSFLQRAVTKKEQNRKSSLLKDLRVLLKGIV